MATGQELLDGLFLGSIYALFGVGYTLVFGVLDIVNLAHSAVFMLGAVFAYSLVALHGVAFAFALPLALAAGGVVGALIELVALRPLRHRDAPQIAALISTVGFALICVAIVEQARPGTLFAWLWRSGANAVSFPPGTVPDTSYRFAGLEVPASKLAILAVSILVMVALWYVVGRTRWGRAMRAVAESPRAASLLGVDVDRIVLGTVVGASILAALAGILFALAISNVSPYIGRDQLELRGLAVIVLGGMGNIPGTILGGYVLGLLEVLALIAFGSGARGGVAFAALFAMLVLRPQGLLGTRARERV